MSRAALGDGSWDLDVINSNKSQTMENDGNNARAADRVRALITVGAIHKPPAKEFENTCVTRGALAYLDTTYPGAYLSKEGVTYVSVGGDAIKGRQKQQDEEVVEGGSKVDADKVGSDQVNKVYKDRGEGSASSVAYTSYAAVSGNGFRTGDGVVPLEWSLLDGSRTIVLEGVLHSINEAGTTVATDRWYGSDAILDMWLGEALEEAGIKVNSRKSEKASATVLDSLQKMLSL